MDANRQGYLGFAIGFAASLGFALWSVPWAFVGFFGVLLLEDVLIRR